MELDDIRRNALAARQFSHVVTVPGGAVTFTLCTPTKLESTIAYANAMGSATRRDSAAGLRFERAVVLLAVVAWAGVLVRHVLPDHAGDEPMAFEDGAAELLLDAQPEWEAELLAVLMQRITARAAVEDTAAKN